MSKETIENNGPKLVAKLVGNSANGKDKDTLCTICKREEEHLSHILTHK